MTAEEFFTKKLEEFYNPLPNGILDQKLPISLMLRWAQQFDELRQQQVNLNPPFVGYRSTSTGEVCDE